MNRGEVWWFTFSHSIGTEVKKRRPAIIISNDASNEFLDRVQLVPLTSSVSRVYPGEALVTLNDEPRKAMANQLTTASKLRVGERIGALSDEDLSRVEGAIRAQLGLR